LEFWQNKFAGSGNVVLGFENVGQFPVVPFRPKRRSIARGNQLHRDAKPVPGTTHAAFVGGSGESRRATRSTMAAEVAPAGRRDH
jgi:hypothetical protein